MKDWGRFYFSFKGRATRMDFNVRFALVSFAVLLVAYGLDCLMAGKIVVSDNIADLPLYNSTSVLVTVSCFAVTCRRLHDLNYSGWWQALYYGAMTVIATTCLYLLSKQEAVFPQHTTIDMTQSPAVILVAVTGSLMMLVSLVLVLFLSAKRGTIGPNRFGPDPLQYNSHPELVSGSRSNIDPETSSG